MAGKLFSISLLCAATTSSRVEANLTTMPGEDWLRFSPSQYYYWSPRDLHQIGVQLAPIMQSGEQVIVVAVDPSALSQGHTLPWIWEWLNDKMARQNAAPATDHQSILAGALSRGKS